jgi:hypothetical protein
MLTLVYQGVVMQPKKDPFTQTQFLGAYCKRAIFGPEEDSILKNEYL